MRLGERQRHAELAQAPLRGGPEVIVVERDPHVLVLLVAPVGEDLAAAAPATLARVPVEVDEDVTPSPSRGGRRMQIPCFVLLRALFLVTFLLVLVLLVLVPFFVVVVLALVGRVEELQVGLVDGGRAGDGDARLVAAVGAALRTKRPPCCQVSRPKNPQQFARKTTFILFMEITYLPAMSPFQLIF